jgi:8-oxo-dGTP pyrophosphatase MutT (NUDIX family)
MASVCSNCGKPGHFFRECSEPITSLGIIAFRQPVGSDSLQWLMIRRRDSLGFIEIMRGKYELRDEGGVQLLIDQTTVSERARLMTQSFLELWRELWNGPASRRYHQEYEQAKAKFEVLRTGGAGRKTLGDYCTASTTAWEEPEWGFPKGRRSSSESEIGCALRETWEEAGVRARDLEIVSTEPLLEEFRGSNGVCYRHRYWVARAPANLEVGIDPRNVDQRREVGAVRWCSYLDAIALIRPYNAEKKAVLSLAISVAVNSLTEEV